MGQWFSAITCWYMGRPEIRVRPGAFFSIGLWLLLLGWQWTAALIMAALVHELGHFAVLWSMGIRVRRMDICFGGAKIQTEYLEPEQELVCAMAGPVAGILLCLFWRWFPRMAFCAIVQSGFNLLPIYPMDGGRVLRAAAATLVNRRNREKEVAKAPDSLYNRSN